MCVETQKTLKNESNIEKEKWNWRKREKIMVIIDKGKDTNA